MKSREELEKLYSDIPEALDNNYNFHLRFSLNQKIKTDFTLNCKQRKQFSRGRIINISKKVG